MVKHLQDYFELAVATSSLVGLVIHALGAEETPWGSRVLHFSMDVVGFLKSFSKEK